MWLRINACRLMMGKPEGMRPPGISKRMWVDNTQINLGKIG
jgi:hypothetical protein